MGDTGSTTSQVDPNTGGIAGAEHTSQPSLVAERLVSINGLISLIMLSWSTFALMKPATLRRMILAFWRRWPWLVGAKPPC